MNDEQSPPASPHTYLLIGFGTPVLPSFMCFLLFAAASFSSNPLPRVLLLTMLTAIVGGCISWLAYRHQDSLGVTALTALLAPWVGFLLSVLIEEGIEHVLAGWGWLTIYDSYDYRIPVQPASM